MSLITPKMSFNSELNSAARLVAHAVIPATQKAEGGQLEIQALLEPQAEFKTNRDNLGSLL